VIEEAIEVPVAQTDAAPVGETVVPRRKHRLAGVVGRLVGVNFTIVALTFLTAPLQARALGPSGRGGLAAIMVPLGLAPSIISFGLSTYSLREAARGRPLRPLVGTIGLMLVLLGGVAALASPLIADLFSNGRDDVETWIVIGFAVLPLGMLNWLLTDLATGQERWRTVMTVRLIPPVATLVGVLGLVATDKLTVATAAATAITAGLLPAVVLLPTLWRIGRPQFSGAVARAAIPFGFKAWLGGLGNLANVRLDQLLMINLVSARQLGLYVVAVSVSGVLVNPLVSALASGTMPRFATGDTELITRVLRTTMVGVAITSIGVAIAAPILVPLAFSDAFWDAVPMAWILLCAGVPLSGITVLSTAMTSKGRPGYSALSETVSLAITVPGLLLLLPRLDALGAALVSLPAYSASLTLLMIGARRHLGASWKDMLVIRHDDVARVKGIFLDKTSRLRRRKDG
jgi:O-antigen/teichoic acid export membrane protein